MIVSVNLKNTGKGACHDNKSQEKGGYILNFPITIKFTENGYIIEQAKKGHNWTNRWVAESVQTLNLIIAQIVQKHWEDEIKRKKEGK
jgi:hypothetical protein